MQMYMFFNASVYSTKCRQIAKANISLHQIKKKLNCIQYFSSLQAIFFTTVHKPKVNVQWVYHDFAFGTADQKNGKDFDFPCKTWKPRRDLWFWQPQELHGSKKNCSGNSEQ